MATSIPSSTWKNGFRQPASSSPVQLPHHKPSRPWINPPSLDVPTSKAENRLGKNVLRTYPTIYNGTASPEGKPSWWKPKSEVDVLVVGAGPTGLETAISLTRQNLTVRIIDKNTSPLVTGRADAVLPRYLETLATWGISTEVSEEGPIIERTAVWKDNKVLHHGRSHQSDSRYRGLHVISQGQLERVFVRDLLRHGILVERDTQMLDYAVSTDPNVNHPVTATIKEGEHGEEEVIRAKFLVGCDGAAGPVRRKLGIPFDGVSTNIYWGIMDCKFKSDYPHAWIFGGYLNSKHGACVVIPREDGYNRLYVQIDLSNDGAVAESRQAKDPSFQEAGGELDVQSITPEEVLAQANRIFDPYKVDFDAPLSWFALWRVSERVARHFSSKDLRVHLAGDAAHVHSVFGAFGLNASILDAANLGWKLGLCCKNKADIQKLLPTYDQERRLHACDIIEISGNYLRYSCGRFDQEVPKLHRAGEPFGDEAIEKSVRGKTSGIPMPPGVELPEHLFLPDFYMRYGAFLLGLDIGYGPSLLNAKQEANDSKDRAVTVDNGVRCPNPRVCFAGGEAGYLYDTMKGSSRFHIIVFASDLHGEIRNQLSVFSKALEAGLFAEYSGKEIFNVVLVTKSLPFELDSPRSDPGLKSLLNAANIVFDDRPPDEDAHYTFGIDHDKGAIVVVRPDLWVGTSIFPREARELQKYFGQFLLPEQVSSSLSNGTITTGEPESTTKLAGKILDDGSGELVYSTPQKKEEHNKNAGKGVKLTPSMQDRPTRGSGLHPGGVPKNEPATITSKTGEYFVTESAAA